MLDIGIYAHTYGSLILGKWKVGKERPSPEVFSTLSIVNGLDDSGTMILRYRRDGDSLSPDKTAICTMTFHCKSPPDFAGIEGSSGSVTFFGPA